MATINSPSLEPRGRKCSNCSAVVTSASAKFCEFCGAELPERAAVANIASPGEVRKHQIERVANHPELDDVLASPPSVVGHQEGVGCGLFGVIFPLGLLIVGAFFFLNVSKGGPISAPPAFRLVFSAVPLAMIGIALLGIFKSMTKAATFENSPLEYVLGVVVDERVEVRGGGENSSATTHYFATVEDRSGQRNEYKIDKKIAAQVSPGDAGVAWVKGKVLIQFRRFIL